MQIKSISALFLMEDFRCERTRVCMQCNTGEALPGWKVGSQTSFVIPVTLNWEKICHAALYAAIKMAETWCSWAWKHAPGGVCVFSHDSSAGGALLSGFHFPKKKKEGLAAHLLLPHRLMVKYSSDVVPPQRWPRFWLQWENLRVWWTSREKGKFFFSELDFLLLYKILNVWYKACLYLRARHFWAVQ